MVKDYARPRVVLHKCTIEKFPLRVRATALIFVIDELNKY